MASAGVRLRANETEISAALRAHEARKYFTLVKPVTSNLIVENSEAFCEGSVSNSCSSCVCTRCCSVVWPCTRVRSSSDHRASVTGGSSVTGTTMVDRRLSVWNTWRPSSRDRLATAKLCLDHDCFTVPMNRDSRDWLWLDDIYDKCNETSSCLQTFIFECKSALNFNP